jgi:multisubunit Na+/H+ antiporter MnhB subunit
MLGGQEHQVEKLQRYGRIGREMARPTDRPRRGSARPPESPFLSPPPRPQLPPAEPRLQQRGVAALALALLSLLAMVLIGNLQRAAVVAGVALAVAVVALVLAISALSEAKRAGSRRPRGAVAGVVLGVIGLLFSGFALLGFLIFGAQLNQYATCMNGANTTAEQQACQTQLDNSITSRIDVLSGR